MIKSGVFSIVALYFALGSGTAAMADITLYDNGPVNGSVDAFSISNGDLVSDSFVLTNNYTVTGADFVAWTYPGDTISNVDWSITSMPDAGTPYGSGTNVSVATTTDYGINTDGLDVALDSFYTGPVDLLSGTYYLNLQNAVVSYGDPAFWDENNGPSTAYGSSIGNLANYDIPNSTGSESFQVFGTTNGLTTPEPSGAVSLCVGALIVGFLCYKRHTRQNSSADVVFLRARKQSS